MAHKLNIERQDYQVWITVIRMAGYSADQCPVCKLVCVAHPGKDPILEGWAQDTLETNQDSPRYGEMLGQADHCYCPDKILGLDG